VDTIIRRHWNEGQSKNLCVQDALAAARERRSACCVTIWGSGRPQHDFSEGGWQQYLDELSTVILP